MRIGDIAAATGLSRDTLRYYEKRGLLRTRRSASGYRDYAPEAVDWLRYVKLAQSLGFTLAEIENGMPLFSATGDSVTEAEQLRTALAGKLDEIDQRIEGLKILRRELARRLEEQMAACPLRS